MKNNSGIFLWVLLILFCSTFLPAQPWDISFEFQAYPTGLIPGVRFEKGFNEKSTTFIRFGYNWIRHRDLGVHEDERGDGFGITAGFKRYFQDGFKGISLSLKNDIWFNKLIWKDHIGTPSEISGITKIMVIQPTVELGYFFYLNKNWFFAPSIAFGYEINVKTRGAKVGEGAIALLGLTLGKRITD